jgi:hypothetical protein
MLKEMIEKLVDLGNGAVLTAHGCAYSRHDLHKLASPEPTPAPFVVHTLSGLVDYVEARGCVGSPGFDQAIMVQPLAVHVGGPTEVRLVSACYGDFLQRLVPVTATPFPIAPFLFGRWLSVEEFVVGLQSCFVPDLHVESLLEFAGSVTRESSASISDDGSSQTVVARHGIVHLANRRVPNPVTLRPYRTFQEIEQPESKYVFRVRPGGDEELPTMALFEGSDNTWQVVATRLVTEFVRERLPDVPIFG